MIDLRLGDCLDILPTLEAGSVDAVITDPPYGTTACKWDTVIPFAPMWTAIERVIKPGAAIVLFGSQPFTSALVMSKPEWFKYEWVWEKAHAANFMAAKHRPLTRHENILVFGQGGVAYNPQIARGPRKRNRSGKKVADRVKQSIYGSKPAILENVLTDTYYPTSVQYCSAGRMADRIHPTQKPVALLEYLIRTYTNPGETVLDFTIGSGTTAVACIRTGRNCIGIENDPDTFEIAKRRIAEAQPALF